MAGRMTAPEQNLVKRALSGHAALGLLAGGLIYLIALTGTMIVVLERWQRWEQPDIAESAVLSPQSAQAAVAPVLAREAGLPKTEHFYIRMPTPDLPRAVVTTDNKAWYIDGQGRIAGREAHTWTEFVAALHINLTLPIVWGMILVGALGVALAALLVTGVVAHPRIFRDAFRLRSRHDPQLARADWHNRLGVWTLPFAVALALTGAFIGLSYAGAGVLAQAHTDGDIDRVYSTIFGEEPASDPAPAPMADFATAMTTLAAMHPEVTPIYVIVHDPLTRGQFVQILAEHPRRLIYGESYTFDANGAYMGKVGLSDGPIGRQAAASTYNLHFGNFAGLPVELAYIAFGIALCVITSTGPTLWLRKRQRKGLRTGRLGAAWSTTVWGIPLALVATAWLRGVGGPDVPLVGVFWLLLAAMLGLATMRPSWFTERRLRVGLAAALAATALLHALYFRPSEIGVLAIDGALLLCALALWRPPLIFRIMQKELSHHSRDSKSGRLL